ncbi:hypothetical protein C8R47DRAFT_1214025 [Mycena vitilis]|nr:hypothetical protein C8R47DRAFT_1214025 [Mycena vitilis]
MNKDIQPRELALGAEKALVQERPNSYGKYPVLTLATEIVSEIFIHFLPPYPLCPPLWGILSPTSLTHICREWRDIALAIPQLWRAMQLSISGHGDGADIERQRDMLDLWLKRSCSYPLSIQLQQFPGSALLLPSLISHRARWECITITALETSDLKFIEGPLPLLRHLDVNLTNRTWDVLDVTQALQLRTVVYNGLAAPRSLFLPWSQITSLTMLRVTPRDCPTILQHTTNLVHCVLDLWSLSPYESSRITLPHLESLRFEPNSDAEPRFLTSLVTPSLRTLKLSEVFFAKSLDRMEFLSQSGGKLEEVTVYTNDIDEDEEAVSEKCFREAFPLVPSFRVVSFVRYRTEH